MNTKKNLVLVVSFVAAAVVWAENTFMISLFEMPESFTIFHLLKTISILGIVYTAWLYWRAEKRNWAYMLGIAVLWLNSSLAGGAVSMLPMILNAAAIGILIGAMGKSLK